MDKQYKGTNNSVVATHNLAYRWDDKYAFWIIEKNETKQEYYNIKSLFRGSFLYVSDKETGYKDNEHNPSLWVCGHPHAPEFAKKKANWKIVIKK